MCLLQIRKVSSGLCLAWLPQTGTLISSGNVITSKERELNDVHMPWHILFHKEISIYLLQLERSQGICGSAINAPLHTIPPPPPSRLAVLQLFWGLYEGTGECGQRLCCSRLSGERVPTMGNSQQQFYFNSLLDRTFGKKCSCV